MLLLAALALFQSASAQNAPVVQTAPSQDVVEGEDIVVRATFGRTTMLFDKGADGKLKNCRIMVSSGSQKRDTDACQATPVCYAKTADEVTDCTEMTILDQAAALVAPVPVTPAGKGGPAVFELPRLVQPKSAIPAAGIGPIATAEESRETERQRVKLPPLPKDETNPPVVHFGVGNTDNHDKDPRDTRP